MKGPGAHFDLPEEVQLRFDQIMTSRIHGLGPNQKVNEVLRSRNFWKAMVNLRARYNARVEASNQKAREFLTEQHDRWKANEITREEFLEHFKLMKRKVPVNVTKHWVYKYKTRWGWTQRKYSAPPSYLEYTHPLMEQWRRRYTDTIKRLKINQLLLLNYDQVWRMVYRGPSTVCFKRRAEAGQKRDPLRNCRAKQRRIQEVARSREGQPPQEFAPRPRRCLYIYTPPPTPMCRNPFKPQ